MTQQNEEVCYPCSVQTPPTKLLRITRMEENPNDKRSIGAEAIATLLSAAAGSGLGWILWLATSNIAVAVGMAGPIAALTNNFLRKVL